MVCLHIVCAMLAYYISESLRSFDKKYVGGNGEKPADETSGGYKGLTANNPKMESGKFAFNRLASIFNFTPRRKHRLLSFVIR